MPRRHVTQADVAALAGVSQSTVSFVLNSRTPRGVHISEDTRTRVLEAIRISGYAANPVAQRLAGGRNQIIGVFTYEKTFPRGGNDFYSAFLHGIEHAAEQLGVDILLFTSAPVVEGERRLAQDGWQRLGIADGCLLLGQREDSAELQQLLDTNYPFVFVGKRVSEGRALPYVGADYVAASARQIERLTAVGHTRIGYAGPASDDVSTQDRIAGYRRGMDDRGLDPVIIEALDANAVAERIVARGVSAVLLSPAIDPDELERELGARGRRVPEHVSLLLAGQSLHTRGPGRRWSGFAVPREEMGARALVLLSHLIASEPRRSRGADGPPAVADRFDDHQLLNCPDIDGDSLAPAPEERPLP